jgi:hypothetical protein
MMIQVAEKKEEILEEMEEKILEIKCPNSIFCSLNKLHSD